MGLDMFAFAMFNKPDQPVDFDDDRAFQIHSWRKHPNLHGWMEALYCEKGGADASFNCANLELAVDDLDRLESAIQEGKLPPTAGFFFGQSDGSELADDLDFVKKARTALRVGMTVFYTSWW